MQTRRVIVTCSLLLLSPGAAFAVDAITVGPAQAERPTVCCLGFVVPIVQGDDNYNASVQVEYRAVGEVVWRTGFPLLRVRPDTLGSETPPGDFGLPDPEPSFAGSIFGLLPATAYEVRLSITDPDGGSTTQTLTATTRAEPRAAPVNARAVHVSTQAQLSSALAAAQPGDVIDLAAGTYSQITLTVSGTDTNPIIVRGASEDSVLVNATGRTYGVDIRSNHVYVENLTVSGSQWGARVQDVTDAVIQHVTFRNVQFGIDGMSGSNYDLYICDNTLVGPHSWPDVSSATWDTEGIAVTGQGHTVCHNTLSGFGDALGLHQNSAMPNAAIDFFGNDVLFTGDDGMELDYAHRNVRAFENRITNAGMGVSLQPVWGGPIYVFRNVFVNLAHSPYKFNNEPTGFLIFNNTSVRTLGDGSYGADAWPQLGYQLSDHWSRVSNFQFKNNLLVGRSGPARVTSALVLADIDNNGWTPDGQFVFYDTFANLQDVKARSPYEAHGLILNAQPFANGFSLPASYTTLIAPQDLSLNSGSNAVDAALLLPNINDDFVGSGPDLGALERGKPPPSYGVRALATVRPMPPTGLTAQ
jgi:hypothetical protein